MNKQQRDQAKALLDEGMSYRDVAEEVGVSKSTLQRVFPKGDALNGDNHDDHDGQEGSSTRRYQLDRQHERQMARIGIEKDRLKIEQQKVQNETRTITLKETELEQKEDEQLEKRVKRKATLVTKYKLLINELLDNAVDSTWDRDEVEEFIERCEDIKERVCAVATQAGEDEEELAIWHGLDYLIDLMEDQLDDNAGNRIDFDLTKAERNEIKELKVVDFDETYEGDEEEDEEDDEEDDDDDEDSEDDEDEDVEETKPGKKAIN